ncbi:lasso peptide biosynthesis B2 protein [Luteimonas sp. SDU101]|uniref:lasso peptide biosynthesis B2 protein n=1 Tax=Luteimonas sp. SDU101 TaxID=3422593 RepID=UPI003EBCF5F3
MPTALSLPDDMSFCDVFGRLVFLDVAGDRYFQLPPELERAFRSYMTGGIEQDGDIDRLTELGVLAEPASHSCRLSAAHATEAARSAMERPRIQGDPLGTTVLLEVFATIVRTQFDLRTTTLKKVLDRLAQYRCHHAPTLESHAKMTGDRQTSIAAAVFRRSRAFVPIQPRCLLDSVALVRFLSARHCHANIVFGVTRDPFSAHCWVQSNDEVLNDSVGNVRTYTPIRII